MSIGTFTKLVNKVRAKLSAPFPKKGRAGGTVQPELQLAIALRWFAGGQMLDVAPLHGVAWNTAWVYVHRVMDAVNSTFNINFGTDVEELKRRGNVEENVGNYWCRKGFYGVAMQAIVDAKLRFLWLGGFAADVPAPPDPATPPGPAANPSSPPGNTRCTTCSNKACFSTTSPA
ncbi:hypothetical protein RI054_02g08970 [Pseudoscourfieldia marina]